MDINFKLSELKHSFRHKRGILLKTLKNKDIVKYRYVIHYLFRDFIIDQNPAFGAFHLFLLF